MIPVIVLKNWTDFKDYAARWNYLTEMVYRLEPTKDGETRVRIFAGRYGLDIVLSKDDGTKQEIADFLKEHNAKHLETVKDVLAFFS